MKPEGQMPLPAGSVTLASLFHEAGYATGGFGKKRLGGRPRGEDSPRHALPPHEGAWHRRRELPQLSRAGNPARGCQFFWLRSQVRPAL